jgi:hypothetical protein
VNLSPSAGARCSYVRSDFEAPGDSTRPVAFHPAPQGGGPRVVAAVDRSSRFVVQPVATGPDGRPGAWYVYVCQTSGERDALYRPPIWIPDAQAGAAAVDPAGLAEQARDQLGLRGPAIVLNPTGRQLVHLPTWMWLDRAGWHAQAATATAGAVSVTATAVPTAVTWTMGDGSLVHCVGPGTPYPSDGDPRAASPDCGYTYNTDSTDQPGGTYTVTATVTWNVTWNGDGQTGAFNGLTTVSTVRVAVISIPALVLGGH